MGHGGGKKCSFPGCTKGYQTGGFCRRHGGGARCQVEGCGKVDAGRGLCRAHGGGKRCQIQDCPKADVGGGFCTAHGGGKRCSEPGCNKIDQGGGKCRAHGGARRCRRRNCQQPARGATGFCTEHGGSRVCSVLSCRRLVRSPGTGTMCATCAKTQPQDSRGSDTSESSSPGTIDAIAHLAVSSAAMLTSFSPVPLSSRCDGSQMANCLENGCARSFGSDCNCVDDCTCNSPTSGGISSVMSTASTSLSGTTSTSCAFQSLLRSTESPVSPSAKASVIMRTELRVKLISDTFGIETVTALLKTISSIRSVHVVPDDDESVASPASTATVSWSIVLRGLESLDLETALEPLRKMNLAQIDIVNQSPQTWARKEVVLSVPEMMCPGNCGSSVLNALRMVDGVEAAKLLFENRQVVVRGDMNVEPLVTAVTDIGFGSEVASETALPRRFRFRVDGLCDVGLNGLRLEKALQAVEGVENLVLLTDRAEVLVIATILQSDPIVDAAARVGFEMLELSEEAWGIPMEVVPPPLGASLSAGDHQSHKCDMRICPQNGCPRYMTTVAHTAALAVGWAVPGCGMSAGGECTCGDGCKCDGCPEHNPSS